MHPFSHHVILRAFYWQATREFEREKERLAHSTEAQRAELQEQLTTAKDQLEMAQLDQQIEAEKANQLEKELENLRGKLEVLEAQQPKNVVRSFAEMINSICIWICFIPRYICRIVLTLVFFFLGRLCWRARQRTSACYWASASA